MRQRQDSHLPFWEGLSLLLPGSVSAKPYTYTESGHNTIGIRGTPVVGVAVVVDVAKVSGIRLVRRRQPPVGPFAETAL